jgi:hypothetical protein
VNRTLQILTPLEATIVRALGQTMYPREGNIPIDAVDARAVEYVDAWLVALPQKERTLLRLMFVLFELSMPLFGPSRTRTFTRADPAAQYEYLAAWETSRLYFRRACMFGLRSVFALAYMADAEVQRRIGVDDGVTTLARHARDARDASDARHRAASVADRAGADIDPGANVTVLAEAVDVVRALDLERRTTDSAGSGRMDESAVAVAGVKAGGAES